MRRKTINVAGFSHGDQPVPAASRIGNLLVTGGIFGLDPERGTIPDAAERLALAPQCGFASSIRGNPLGEDDQKAKLARIVEVAHEVWADT